jgi:hypothetical protein
LLNMLNRGFGVSCYYLSIDFAESRMVNKVRLRTETKRAAAWSSAPQDCVIHCRDGPVPASSLLLACLSPSLRGLLGARGEQEEPLHLSCPDLEAAHLSAFLGGLYAGGKDVFYTSGVNGFLFPERKSTIEISAVKSNTALPPNGQNVKQGSVYDDIDNNVKEEMEDYADDYKEDNNIHDFIEDEVTHSENSSDLDYVEEKKKSAGKNKNRTPRKTPCKLVRPKCPHCAKSYNLKTGLEKHIEGRRCAVQKHYTCEECGKGLKSKQAFEDHMQMHTGIPNHLCDKCDQKCYSRAALTNHVINKHDHCCCETCGKGFTNQRALTDHMNIHLNLKPYICREGCDMAYSDRSCRNQHERRAHGVRGGLPVRNRTKKKKKKGMQRESFENNTI